MTRVRNGNWTAGEQDSEERFRSRKRHKPQGRRRVAELVVQAQEDPADELIQRLKDLGHLTEVIAELKSGKEATAFVGRSDRGTVLLKIYHDPKVRNFQNDSIYQAGKVQLDERMRRAIKNRSKTGLNELQAEWVCAEYAHLWRLWRAGLPVPEPLVGPSLKECGLTVPAVLMRLIGAEDAPAPRLSDVRLSPLEARRAWDQALDGMAGMLQLGYAHGDYSTYNLLWWENTVTIIDFPQLTTRKNPHFQDLLMRDAASLAQSFKRHGLQETAQETLREVQRRALKASPQPRVLLP